MIFTSRKDQKKIFLPYQNEDTKNKYGAWDIVIVKVCFVFLTFHYLCYLGIVSIKDTLWLRVGLFVALWNEPA